ncbi:hypothetical protein H1164_08140 [Thermoactinomyces daqus]|uniref:Uncharacterized protein n=1 Tax=Thermoactinomyces daqus TaxID=1329516 RepID=A0A7W1XA60_9BACL|nr:hypothetical protein [Thermoactinomyces daqus]MBA4542869.1 hypothetical protein [Thermoactinomyces daqus]
MPKEKLPSAKNWRERKIETWNATTFHEYLKHKHQERFSLSYRAGNIRGQNSQIKRLYEEIGKEATKEFIDLCFQTYKPRQGYNSLNFFYMIRSMNFLIPKAVDNIERKRKIAEMKQRQQQQEIQQPEVNKGEVENILKYWGIE